MLRFHLKGKAQKQDGTRLEPTCVRGVSDWLDGWMAAWAQCQQRFTDRLRIFGEKCP